MTTAQTASVAYAVISRLAYVVLVGLALRREERFGPIMEFRRFRRLAAFLMNNDALAFILLCFVTRHTLILSVSETLSIAVGTVLVIVGIGTKWWAARTLGSDAYYWRNFFDPAAGPGPVSTGPYRFASNPMYTIGYLQTYGLALILRSFPGLLMSLFSQAGILAFYFLVEKPHFQRLHRSS